MVDNLTLTIKFLGIAILLLLTCSTEVYAFSGDYVPGELLIKFKGATAPLLRATSGVNNPRIRALKSMNASVLKRLPISGMEQWKLPAGMNVQKAVQQLRNDPNVEYAEPNYRRYLRAVPNDPGFTQQWGLQNTGQPVKGVVGVPGADMGLTTAWATQTGSRGVVVAVIDDSIDINHPDLAANIWINPGEIAGDGIDNDGNGFIDDVNGWDFLNNDANPSADPGTGQGHGTEVAGCIGAVGNNGVGITGVNWNVSIMPLKFGLDVASEVAAFDYAIANGATIINASFGGPGPGSQAERDAVQRLQNAGILLVVAAGNNDGDNDRVPDAPSGYPNANILSVAGSESSDNVISWSNYGATSVDVAAPGKNIYTSSSPNGYIFSDGTSFSSPYVAGIAALLKAQYPAATYQELKGRIIASVTPVASMRGLLSSAGRADAGVALTVPVQPALVISHVVWNDGGNGLIDPGETATLAITLENDWSAATGVNAIITPLSSNLIVNSGTAVYPNIGSGATQTANFNISTTPASGYQLYQFKLDITAAGGYAVTRYYQIGMGALGNGITYNGTLNSTNQDDYELFFVDVPSGATKLVVTSNSGQDIDLMLKRNGIPIFDFANYSFVPAPPGTQMAATPSGNESITLTSPVAGTYYLLVLNYSQLPNTPFTIRTDITMKAAPPVASTPPPVSGGGGGGCVLMSRTDFDPTFFTMLLLSILYLLQKGKTSPRKEFISS